MVLTAILKPLPSYYKKGRIMSELSLNEKYDYFCKTFNSCGTFLLKCNETDIDYYLFEEFDGDCISFLNEKMLQSLLESGFINADIKNKSMELSKKFRSLENTPYWQSHCVKTYKPWQDILKLSDDIKSMLNENCKKRN